MTGPTLGRIDQRDNLRAETRPTTRLKAQQYLGVSDGSCRWRHRLGGQRLLADIINEAESRGHSGNLHPARTYPVCHVRRYRLSRQCHPGTDGPRGEVE